MHSTLYTGSENNLTHQHDLARYLSFPPSRKPSRSSSSSIACSSEPFTHRPTTYSRPRSTAVGQWTAFFRLLLPESAHEKCGYNMRLNSVFFYPAFLAILQHITRTLAVSGALCPLQDGGQDYASATRPRQSKKEVRGEAGFQHVGGIESRTLILAVAPLSACRTTLGLCTDVAVCCCRPVYCCSPLQTKLHGGPIA